MTTTERWIPVDQVALLPASMQSVAVELARASLELDRIVLDFAGVLAGMRECSAGQPKAANTDPPGDGPALWCWEHERDVRACRDERLLCDGEVVESATDTVGEAAIVPDRWARQIADHLSDARKITAAVKAMSARALLVPADAVERQSPIGDSGPGEEWCSNCWRSNKSHQPIDRRKRQPTEDDPRTSVPYYTGLCRWCGDAKAAHGFLPPPHLVDLHHRSIRITPGQWAEEKKKHRSPERTKSKKGKRTKVRRSGSAA